MKPCQWRSLVGLIALSFACVTPSGLSDDKPCPCANGFYCDVDANRCVPGQRLDAGRDGGAAQGVDAVPTTCWRDAVGCDWTGTFTFVEDDGVALAELTGFRNPTFAPDGCSLYYTVSGVVHVARRASADAPFRSPRSVEVNITGAENGKVTITPDALEILLTSRATGRSEVYRARRLSTTAGWGTAALAEDINSPDFPTLDAVLSPSGLSVLFARDDGGEGADLWVARRTSLDSTFGTVERLSLSLPSTGEAEPSVTANERVLAFVRGVDGVGQLHYATRPSTEGAFEVRGLVPARFLERGPDPEVALSPDGCELLVNRSGDDPVRLLHR